jgi:hypothetical protein
MHAMRFVLLFHRPALHTGLLIATLVSQCGCEKSNKPILPSTIQNRGSNTQAPSTRIAHPEYANWSRFDVGTQAIRDRVVSNASGKVHVTTSLTLAEKTDEHVEIVSQVTVQRPNEAIQENPPESTRFPATFALPDGMTKEYFQLPSPKAVKISEEPQELAGKSFVADVYEWTESNETGPMKIKLWRSDEVPGRIYRQEMLIESSQTTTTEVLRQVEGSTVLPQPNL